MLSCEERSRCFEMFRRLGATGFDGEAAWWLVKRKPVADEFMMEHFDSLSPRERMRVYLLLFGLFKDSFKSVVERRLELDQGSGMQKAAGADQGTALGCG
jgi:hypothetical protein